MTVTKADINQAIADSNKAIMEFNAVVGALEEIEDQIKQMNFGRALELIKHLRNAPSWAVVSTVENIRSRLS